MSKQKTLTIIIVLCFILPIFSVMPLSSAQSTNKVYIVYQGSLLDSGSPNSDAERIVNAKITYGYPNIIEVTTAYPWGEINNDLVDYFHSAGIIVSARVWSGGGSNPLATIEGQIDEILALASSVDMIMIDECNGDMYAYLTTLSNYVHNDLEKLIAFNMAGNTFSENFVALADHITTEFWWRQFIDNHSDLLTDYPDFFAGQVNDWGYDFLGSSVTVDLEQAIADTNEAWNGGISYFYASNGEGFTLPTWFEEYLDAIGNLVTNPTIFGNSNIELASNNWINSQLIGCKFTTPSDVNILTSINVYVSADTVTTGKAFLYSDVNGVPTTLLATGTEFTISTSFAWCSSVFNYSLTELTAYWLCFMTNESSGYHYTRETSGSVNQLAFAEELTYPSASNPFAPDGYLNNKMSIYGEYTLLTTPTATATPTAAPTASPTAAPTSTTDLVYSDSITPHVYYFIFLIAIILFGIVLSLTVHPVLGIAFGIVGLVGTAFFINAGVLIINQYVDANTLITHIEAMPIGLYYIIPMLLSVISILAPIMKKMRMN